MRLLGIVLFMLCCVGAAWPATYYVATTGNDGNAGSAAEPWATLRNSS